VNGNMAVDWILVLGTAGGALTAVALLALVMYVAAKEPQQELTPVRGTSEAVKSGQPPKRTVAHDVWPRVWTHTAPDEPFTIPQAHREMQRHRDCGLDHCPRKDAAFTVLVEAGRVTPDSSRQQ